MRKSKFFVWFVFLLSVCFLFGVSALTVSAIGETHTVSFFLSDGVGYEGQDQLVEDGGHAVVPPTPERDGYVFLYWHLESGSRFSFRTEITEDVALYAEWLALGEGDSVTQIYTVEFWVGDSLVSRQSVEQGQNAIAPTGFECPEGKTFVAWDGSFENVAGDLTINATLTDSVYTVTIYGIDGALIGTQQIVHGGNADLSALPQVAHYTIDDDTPYFGEAEGITCDGEIWINYIPDTYTVRFVADDEPFGEQQEVQYGDTAGFPDIPVKEHYIFIGWYLDPADISMFDFNLPIEENTTLYAKYIPIENKKYSVSFFQYDGSQYGSVQLVEEGKTAIAPGTPGREGYTFLGWYDEETDDLFDFDAPIESDRTAIARFQIKTYLVTIYDGDEIISEQTVKCGESAEKPEIPEKEGYVFTGFDGSFANIRGDTVIRVRYTVKTFSVMFFDANQKKIGGTQYIEYGKSATAPRAPEREGYTFLGWSEEFANVTEDLVLFPEYKRNEYAVRFFDGTEELASETVGYGDRTNGIQPEKDGFIFIGWLTANNAAFDLNTSITEAIDLYANWQEKPPVVHTVRFLLDNAVYSTQTVADGAPAQTPANPVKIGYTFTGWDADFSCVTDDLTVNALFEINTYTVTFTVNGSVFHVEEVEYGECVAPPDTEPEKNGYRFARWSFDFETPITDDITVKAVFEIMSYQVRFVVEDEDYSVQTVEYGDYADIPGTPQLNGKVFASWYLENGERFRFSTAITADTVITAQFETITCTVTFITDGTPYHTETVEYGETVAAPSAPEKEGYRFIGWNFDFDTPITSDLTVTATFERITYTVTFLVNGQEWQSATVTYGAQVAQPETAPRLVGYRFVRWDFNFNTPITADTEIPAIIERITFTVSFMVNGRIEDALTVEYGGTVEAPDTAPQKEGYRFVGWNFNFETPITADTTVEALFEIIRNTVTFTVDGQTFETATVEYGGAVEAPDANPQKEGYRFIGWNFNFETPITADTTVEALFEIIRNTVTFTVDGQTFETATVEYGKKVDAPEVAPQMEGYRFVGWDFDFTTPIYKNITIKAVFEEIVPETHIVTFKVDGTVYQTVQVTDGATVEAPGINPQKEGYRFVGWRFNFATPIYEDVVIEAVIEAAVTETNLFVVDTVRNNDGTVTAVIRLTGDVRAAGFIGSLSYDPTNAQLVDLAYDSANGTAMDFSKEVRFVWSYPVNLTEETTFLVLTFTVNEGAEPVFRLNISELLALDENGNLTPDGYSIRN